VKFLVWLLVLVLEVPVAVWMQIPSQERDRIKLETITDFCRNEAEKGAKSFIIGERVYKFNWQLHIDVLERRI